MVEKIPRINRGKAIHQFIGGIVRGSGISWSKPERSLFTGAKPTDLGLVVVAGLLENEMQ